VTRLMVPARLFAAVYDRTMALSEEAGLRELRRAALAPARGRTLEIGAGTGLNAGLYPPAVTSLVLTEPEEPMARRLRLRSPGAEIVPAGAEELPFDDGSFDTVVSTLVLCTVPDLDAALAEIARVLVPRGRLLVLEHVRSGDAGLARWQDRLTPAWRVVARGCHPNRDTAAAITGAGFAFEELEHSRIPKATPIVRPLIRGVARPAG
jgi:ubiquinone/menaquinone biosynthesis C-methylase UbiE